MFEWEWLFFEKILERGRAIFSSAISNVAITEEGLTAKVQGTSEYTVKIDKELDWISCDCPFASEHPLFCKHMAALFFYLQNSEKQEEKEYWKKLSHSPLAQKALELKAKNQEKREAQKAKEDAKVERERIAAEKWADWWRTLPERKAAEEEKRKQAEERKKERERKAEEKRKREEERYKKLLAKIKEAEKKRKEQEKIWIAERERRKAEMEEWKKQQAILEEKRKEEEKRRKALEEVKQEEARIKAEEDRQRKIDEDTARRIKHLPAAERKWLEEQNKYLEDLERENIDYSLDAIPPYTDDERLKDTGWYYSDVDEIEGVEYIDKYGKRIFVPDGFDLKE